MKEDIWANRKLGDIADIIMGQSPDGNSINDSEGIEFHQGKLAFGEKYLKHSNNYTSKPTKIAPTHSLLLCVRAPIGTLNITDREVCIGRGLCAINANNQTSNKFLYYALSNQQNYFEENATGSTFKAISTALIKGTKIPIPPISEQQAIANFLDKKTGEIDQAIALLETQKTDLQAYRQALITETMTKGLNPNAPMKDSGIQWIGEIPESWCITRIKYLANTQENSFIDGDWIESPYVTDIGIRYLTSGNIGNGVFKRQGNGYITEDTFQKLNCKYAYPGDLVFCRLNQPFGRSCILPDDQDRYVLAVDNVILRTNEDKRYICYLTQLERYQNYIGMLANGTAMQRISRTKLGNVNVPLPPLSEQHVIADYLDKKTSDIDTALNQMDTQIADLQAYRTALISEAVTGKIDVR